MLRTWFLLSRILEFVIDQNVNSATRIKENPLPHIDNLNDSGSLSGSSSSKGAYIRLAPSGGFGMPFSMMIDPSVLS
jgi:hypothetical protein